MSRVHPNAAAAAANAAAAAEESTVLTVWRKSLLFNCEGFTVFDYKGDLIFRMDNYGAGNRKNKKKREKFVLMNADGKPLLTIRRKNPSLMAEQWLVYEGEEVKSSPLLSVKKEISFLYRTAAIARVRSGENLCSMFVEGSYLKRSAAVYDGGRRRMAEIKKKEAARGIGLGADVFRLVVQPGFDSASAMAVVVILEQMFQSRE